MGKCRHDAVGPVTCDECKWNFPIGEYVGDGIGFFAAQIHVENARLQIVAFGGEDRVAEPAVGTIDLVTEGRQHVGQHHRNQWLVFDKQDALVARIERRWLGRRAIELRA